MVARTLDGAEYYFGVTADARFWTAPGYFRLDLFAVLDPHGNHAEFYYGQENGSDARWLTRIRGTTAPRCFSTTSRAPTR